MEFAEKATGTSLPSADNSGPKRTIAGLLARARKKKKSGKSGGDIGRLFTAGARNMPCAEIARRSLRRV